MKTNTLIIVCCMAFSPNLFSQNYSLKPVKTFAAQDQSNNLDKTKKTTKNVSLNQFELAAELVEDLDVFNELNDLGEDFFVTFQPPKAIGRCQSPSSQRIGKADKFHDDFYREMRVEFRILTQQEPYKSVAQSY
jgi:hypothetical protein